MRQLDWFSRDLTALVHSLVSGRLCGIISTTGVGKTLFDLNTVARWLEDAVRVMVVATEETLRYLDMLACWAAGVSYRDLIYEWLGAAERETVDRWRVPYERHEGLYLLPTREPTLGDIIEAARRCVPDVLMVDHLHELEREGHPLPVFLDLAMGTLSDLATTLDIPVVFFAQVHRPHSHDRLYRYRIPTLHSGLGSPKIEQKSDIVLGLSRKLLDDAPRDALARLAKGLLRRGESERDYEERNTARVTVLKHRPDDEQQGKSILLTVCGGKMQDRIALAEGTTDLPVEEEGDDAPPF